ncbi:MAG: hypothetical protein KBT27_14920 [Prevotellaceae bacterium]|nr:hypothetical protein [Candidatus Faecinaster equi]
MIEEQEPVKACERYRRTIEGYKARLATEPDLRLKSYCKEVCCDYHSLGHWCSRHGISVVSIRREVFSSWGSSKSSQESKDPGLFVQFRPALPVSVSSVLKGVSITFPDATNLTLQECHVEEVISLLDIYRQRKGVE